MIAFDPFDLTKVWPHADCPLIDVGIMQLNRNPDNYFAETMRGAPAENIGEVIGGDTNRFPGIGEQVDQ